MEVKYHVLKIKCLTINVTVIIDLKALILAWKILPKLLEKCFINISSELEEVSVIQC